MSITENSADSKSKTLDSQEYILQLEQELAERKRSEKLQHALFKIASIDYNSNDLDLFYQQIHSIIDKLIYAKNFFIALYSEEDLSLTIPYFIDEKDDNHFKGRKLPIGKGVSAYVIRTRMPQLLDLSQINVLIAQGEIEGILGSADFTSWMGAPMISANVLHGLIVVQSYDKDIIYNDNDLMLLNFVAQHVANAIDTVVNTQQRKDSQLKMAKQHRLLEEKNQDLNHVIEQLKATQEELIQKEKMASLGGLVAGIAHEINTPLGICVTGVSHLQEEYKIIKQSIDDKTLTEVNLMNFFEDMGEVLVILSTNTLRGASLVNSFKQVAVDQSSNEVRNINVLQYIDEITLSLRPKLKRTNITIDVECDSRLFINVNAGAISQIFSNLILNSVNHAFDEKTKGKILIEVYEKNASIIIRYRDDGKGIDDEALKLLFEPFYTTKRGEGGSGLGTHLVYNLVTGSLKGKITVKSQVGKGLAYLIKFPVG
ncbi:MAG: GAF domain-containing sensor histidine kinase [Colwellia sp.]|nr:GAF domain-containing sensor histidine kinase [Colwellia sp.]